MAAGTASWSDISATANYIMEDALAVARMVNVLAPTVTGFSAQGMQVRQGWQWNSLAFSAKTEEVDTASNAFVKDTLSSLTPTNLHCRADLTDERIETDSENARAALALELGSAAAAKIDTDLATLFGTTNLGGTIGAGIGSTISWRSITKAYALLMNQGVPAGMPVFCALHPYQFEVLLAASSIAGSNVTVAPEYANRVMAAPNFFRLPDAFGITFVVTNAITISGTAAYGCLYVPQAFALDTRKPFGVEPERDASKQAWEFNARMWYAYGKWRPAFAISLNHNAATPS